MSKSENATLVAPEDQFDDRLSLLDLMAFIRRNLGNLLGGALLGGILGLALAFVLPVQ